MPKLMALNGGTWQPRGPISPPLLKGIAAKFRLMEVTDDGPETVDGNRCTEITPMQFLKRTNETIYLVPKAAVAGPPTHRQDVLRAIEVQEQSTFIHIWVYSPALKELPLETPRERIVRLAAAVGRAARYSPDVFLGPEYLFTRNGALEPGEEGVLAKVDRTYSEDDKAMVETAVRELSRDHPKMLLMPGTVLWKSRAGAVRNTGFISCRAEGLFLEHSKHSTHSDDAFAAHAGGTWASGTASTEFYFRGLRCRYEICKDNSMSAASVDGVELHFLAGYAAGTLQPMAHGGGWEVVSDGLGVGKIGQTPKPGELLPPGNAPGHEAHSLVVHVHKRK